MGFLMDSVVEGGWIARLFSEFHYLAPFTVLLLCGIGLPLPEEVSLLGSGLLVYHGDVEFVPIVLVCSAAILLGDTIPFFLGRRYGMSALALPGVARILHPDRMEILKQRFEEHGSWAVFTCRFLPGIRIPSYFMAGTLRMKYPRFLLLDGLGVAISVPISIWVGHFFGEQIQRANERIRDLHLLLGFGVVSLVVILVVRSRAQRAQRRKDNRTHATDPERESAPAPEPGSGDSPDPAAKS